MIHKLIVGLGNPGTRYEYTRHNIGFFVLHAKELHWKAWGAQANGAQKNSEISEVQHSQSKIYFLKPLTYMNKSGEAVLEFMHFYKIPIEELCVLHDDLDLEFGVVRLKQGGGEGGHRGLVSLTQCLGTAAYSRIRIGIGHPVKRGLFLDPADYVLQKFNPEEEKMLPDITKKATQAVDAFIEGADSFQKLMNSFNQRPGA